MNKKEIAEIKKQFTPDRCSITRICGCYVDGEKNKKTELKEAFLSLSEEETFKYFDIFRKTLTGTIGKNLINMEFPLDQETEGGTQNFLMKLRKSKLTDDTLTEAFYDRIIENYDYGENYYIILIHAVYDDFVVEGFGEGVVGEFAFTKLHKEVLGSAFRFLVQRKFHVDEVFSDGAGEGFSEDVEVFKSFFF